jgi:diaminopimelate decarboxylase
MNRTQCRTSSDDFLVDPLVVPSGSRPPDPDPRPIYLTGAYCIEKELLCWRALRTPHGLNPGDVVVWPNTAGYFMHFLESRSHQLPIAKNLVHNPAVDRFDLDAIDRQAE